VGAVVGEAVGTALGVAVGFAVGRLEASGRCTVEPLHAAIASAPTPNNTRNDRFTK
jgi:hypothetical protein